VQAALAPATGKTSSETGVLSVSVRATACTRRKLGSRSNHPSTQPCGLTVHPSWPLLQVGPDTNERFVLCHLTPGKVEQWAIDLGFGPDEEVRAAAHSPRASNSVPFL